MLALFGNVIRGQYHPILFEIRLLLLFLYTGDIVVVSGISDVSGRGVGNVTGRRIDSNECRG